MSLFCDLFYYHSIDIGSLESFSRIKLTNIYSIRILNTFASTVAALGNCVQVPCNGKVALDNLVTINNHPWLSTINTNGPKNTTLVTWELKRKALFLSYSLRILQKIILACWIFVIHSTQTDIHDESTYLTVSENSPGELSLGRTRKAPSFCIYWPLSLFSNSIPSPSAREIRLIYQLKYKTTNEYKKGAADQNISLHNSMSIVALIVDTLATYTETT